MILLKAKAMSKILAFAVIFIPLLFYTNSLDPDFGYRLRSGQMILSGNIPRTDPYSYTMPSYPYVEHAFLVALFWGLIYPFVGLAGLRMISSLVLLAAILVSFSSAGLSDKVKPIIEKPIRFNLGIFGNFLFVLAITSMFPFFGIRAQVFSWLMFAVLVKVLYQKDVFQKYKKYLPLFFLFWANLHGSFVAGLGILTVYFLVNIVKAKRLVIINTLPLVVSYLATLINPYGLGAWKEALVSMFDSKLRFRIAEWSPSLFYLDFTLVFFLALSTFLANKYRKQIGPEKIVIYLLFLIQAILSKRNIPIWIIVSIPLVCDGLNYIYDEIKNIRFAIPRFKKVITYTWIMTVLISMASWYLNLRETGKYAEDKFYPQKAISYLKSNAPQGNLYSDYGWGGYLIWKLPEKKLFIDGRMPSWRWDKNPVNEESDAFDVYWKITSGDIYYKDKFTKYSIDTVLLPKPDEEGKDKKKFGAVFAWLNNLFHLDKPFDLIADLKRDGWVIVFEDDISVIYKKS